ncbi:MAG: glycosyltransferase family 4 protein [Acidobacteria bacterium]|nr:glycosyltransferase family 4 protein [Acidobacteriota bacterium]
MRIGHVVVKGSGVEVYHDRLAQSLARLGVEPKVWKFSPRWEYVPAALPWLLTRRQVAEAGVQLLHTNVEYGCFFRKKPWPLLATLHHSSVDADFLLSLPPFKRWHHACILKPIVRRGLTLADRLVAVSQDTRQFFCQVFQRDLAVEVIHNGIDPELFAPNPTSCTEDRSVIRLFFSGNPSYRKGFDLLAPVMQRLGSDFVLSYTTGLRRVASAPLVGPNIRCLGKLTSAHVVEEINRADIALQPSRREGFGLSILEAMACGKPVVSSNCSAIPELVEHGQGGLLCEVGAVDQLVGAIRNLAQSAQTRHRMGEHNRQVVLQRFTLEQMASRYHTVYKSMLG